MMRFLSILPEKKLLPKLLLLLCFLAIGACQSLPETFDAKKLGTVGHSEECRPWLLVCGE